MKGATAAVVAGVLVAIVAGALVDGWLLMLVVGALHSWGVLPATLGYWPCVGVAVVLNLIFGSLSRRR